MRLLKLIGYFVILALLITALFLLPPGDALLLTILKYLIIAGMIIVLGILVWQYKSQTIKVKPRSKYGLPSSALDENPRIAYNKSMQLICDQLKAVKSFYNPAIYMIDPDSMSFVLQHSTVDYFTKSVDSNNKIFSTIFKEAQTLIIKPNEVPDEWDTFFYDFETNEANCFLGARIIYGRMPIGVLFVFVEDVRKVESNDQIIIQQFANQASLGLSLIDKIESHQKHHQIQNKINTIYKNADISQNKSSIYGKIVELVQDLFKYDKLTMMIGDVDGEHARIERVDGYTLDIGMDEVFPLKNSIFTKVIQDNVVINTKDRKKDFGKRYRFYEDEQTKRNISAVLAVPFYVNEEISGCISLERFEPKEFSDISQYYLEEIAMLLSVLLGWQADYHRMFLNTTHDSLTGLMNYHAFLRRLDIEINRSTRAEQSLVLIIIDVDKFKNVNDSLGHEFGNYALKKIADILKESVRTIDLVARYGGEEFIIVISDSSKDDAEQIAQRIVSNIAGYTFIFNEQRMRITISAGIAEFPGDSDQVKQLIELADQAMYNAKGFGGNTVGV